MAESNTDTWHAERERLRRERERTAWLLVEAEQRIAVLLAEAHQREAAATSNDAGDLHAEIANLRRIIDELRSSTSWRFTRPLRAISGLLRGKR